MAGPAPLMAGPLATQGTLSVSGFGNGLRRSSGGLKTVGGFRRTRYKGLDRTGLAGYLVATAYNLVRMAKLLELAKEAPEAQAA